METHLYTFREKMEAALGQAIERHDLKTLKENQRKTIEHLVNRKNVFCVLPTGFAKSLCYHLLPAILNIVRMPEVEKPASFIF